MCQPDIGEGAIEQLAESVQSYLEEQGEELALPPSIQFKPLLTEEDVEKVWFYIYKPTLFYEAYNAKWDDNATPSVNLGFFSNGADGTVTVFDLSSLQVKTKLSVGMGPDAIFDDREDLCFQRQERNRLCHRCNPEEGGRRNLARWQTRVCPRRTATGQCSTPWKT